MNLFMNYLQRFDKLYRIRLKLYGKKNTKSENSNRTIKASTDPVDCPSIAGPKAGPVSRHELKSQTLTWFNFSLLTYRSS